jgi:indolepyruvate ferredoxin oxidoreductase beta subunit
MTTTTNVILCGTGGQGILLASEVISYAAMASGMDVKKSEVHGMAQRGGSVSSHVRFGEKVYSPLVEKGTADMILAMEMMEGVRWAPFLSPGGRLIIPDLEINPMTVNTGQAEYPDVVALLDGQSIPYSQVPAYGIASELGNLRVLNVVLLGAVSSWIDRIPEENWLAALEERVPARALEVNMTAFRRGRTLTLGQR